MESLCRIRDLYRSIVEFEASFQTQHTLCLNEGMLLCTLQARSQCSSGEIAEQLGLTPSNTSKVICSVERKGLVQRVLGEADKRQMYFSLTDLGEQKLREIHCDEIEIPAVLQKTLEKM